MSGFFKAFVAVILAGVMGIAFQIVMYQPKQKQILAVDAQIEQQQQKYEELKIESENLARWEQARVQFQQILQSLHQTRPMKDFIPSFLTDIEKMAKRERAATSDPSFEVTLVTPGAVSQTAPSAGAAPSSKGTVTTPPPSAGVESGHTAIQLNFTGRFYTIIDFLQELGNFKLNKLVTIQRISLSPQAAEGGGSPTLSVTMPFEVYMLGGGG